MSSRTLFHQFVHVSKKLHCSKTLVRPLSALLQIQQCNDNSPQRYNNDSSPERYNQIRRLCSKAAEGLVINIQDEKDFDERVIKNKKPVVVDFHATWCGPCKLLGPRLESLVGSKKGKVILAKVDVDEQSEIAFKYMINSVPTVIGFRNKEVLEKFVGLQDDDIIDSFLERLIG